MLYALFIIIRPSFFREDIINRYAVSFFLTWTVSVVQRFLMKCRFSSHVLVLVYLQINLKKFGVYPIFSHHFELLTM